MRFLCKILLLPILTTLLVIIMLDIQSIPALLLLNIAELLECLSDPTFWAAVEAIATFLALGAVGLAACDYRRKRRREEEQRQALRLMLSLEVRDNVYQMKVLSRHLSHQHELLREELLPEPSDQTWGSEFPGNLLAIPDREIHFTTKDRLEKQLDLWCMAFTAVEILRIREFYEELSVWQIQVLNYNSLPRDTLLTVLDLRFTMMVATISKIKQIGTNLMEMLPDPGAYAEELAARSLASSTDR